MKEVTKALAILSAGFVAGAVVGVLFAPDKGEKTRAKIKKKAEELSDKVHDKYNEEIEYLKSKIEELKNGNKTAAAGKGAK
ncbi:MAG: YtxH domain-containing protein [Flavobacteriales bacterium]|nr:YtxH domain-containing protein [Flavobacteriales bacterium]